jgi:hypothetical protein
MRGVPELPGKGGINTNPSPRNPGWPAEARPSCRTVWKGRKGERAPTPCRSTGIFVDSFPFYAHRLILAAASPTTVKTLTKDVRMLDLSLGCLQPAYRDR